MARSDSTATVPGGTLAQLFDCDERTIRNLAKRGVIVKAARGQYVLAASIRNYVRHLRDQASGRQGRDELIDAVTENALLRRSQREGQELKNAMLAGQVIRKDDLFPAWARVVRAVRANVLALPNKIAFAMPHLTPHDREMIDQLTRDALYDAAMSDTPPQADVVGPDQVADERAIAGSHSPID